MRRGVQHRLRQTTHRLREETAPAVREARTAWPHLVRTLAVSAAAGLFLALIGALGSGDMPILPRLAFWIGLCLIGGLLGPAVGWLLSRTPLGRRPSWVMLAGVAMVLFPLFCVLVWLINGLILGRGLRVGDLPGYALPCLVMTVGMSALFGLSQRAAATVAVATPATGADKPVRFLDRLPHRLRGAAIHAVEAQDHYLRVHTNRGDDLILMRLSDAVAELEGIEGARTHRSWWVARAAVVEARRGDGRAVLTLPGGIEAPVSRAYAKALRAAGWF